MRHHVHTRNDGQKDRTTNLLIFSNVHYVHLGGDKADEVTCISINQLINQSMSQKITTYKSDQWCTTHLKTKIKPKDNVQKVKTTQR